MLPTKLAFVDIETTGGRSTYDRIIEIGIVQVENDSIIDTFSTLINPGTHIPQEIVGITGITSDDVAHAPTFREIAPEIITRLKDFTFVAHNVRFDYGFLKNEFARLGYTFTSKHFCTVRLSRLLYPTSSRHNLDSIIERHGIPCTNRHRALDDAQVIYEFFKQAKNTISEPVFTQALKQVLKKPYLPVKLSPETLDNLPETSGVYIFYGAESESSDQTPCDPEQSDASTRVDVETSVKLRRTKNQIPLYIGKSINIKERVLSHFAGDVHSPLEMKIAQQVESIETITTAGELGALFLESQLVKSMLPLYNRMLRRKRELIVLTQHKSEDGYYIVKLDTLQEPSLTLLPDTLGFFRSKKQAKDYLSQLAKEYQLCEKLLGLEKTQGACFGQRLDRCKGACISEELPIAYNLRFMTALGKKKIKEWPYKGPLLIHERNEALQITEHFLIDKWCFLGSIKEDDYGSINPTDFSYQFDLDTYKILMRYLSSPNNEKNIQILNHNKIHSQGRDFRFVE